MSLAEEALLKQILRLREMTKSYERAGSTMSHVDEIIGLSNAMAKLSEVYYSERNRRISKLEL